jgi:hypothetical protein
VNYQQAGRQQLFDLQNDPHELHDLSDDAVHQTTLQRLQSLLQTWLRQNGDVP